MKRVFLLLNLIILVSKASYWLNEGFKINKILLRTSPTTLSYVSSEEPDFDSIFNQNFRYLTKGTKAYIFESEDGLYVMKCFRMDQANPPFWTKIYKKETLENTKMKNWANIIGLQKSVLKKKQGSFMCTWKRLVT